MAGADSGRPFLDAAVLSRLARLTVQARSPMLGTISGLHRSATRGSSVEFAEYRKYVPGDDIKHLDWRVFARTDRFYMKEFEAETNLRCYLVVDASASMGFAHNDGTRLDYAKSIAATLAQLLVKQNDSVGLLCFNERNLIDIPARHSPVHLRSIYDTLEALEPEGETDLPAVLHGLAERIQPRSLVVLVSDLLAEPEPLVSCFQHLRFRKHDVAVFHLIDQQEMEFDFARPVRFVDMESSLDLIADPAVIQASYHAALNKHLDMLRDTCREFGIDYHAVLTSKSYEEVLAAFLLARLGRSRSGGRA